MRVPLRRVCQSSVALDVGLQPHYPTFLCVLHYLLPGSWSSASCNLGKTAKDQSEQEAEMSSLTFSTNTESGSGYKMIPLEPWCPSPTLMGSCEISISIEKQRLPYYTISSLLHTRNIFNLLIERWQCTVLVSLHMVPCVPKIIKNGVKVRNLKPCSHPVPLWVLHNTLLQHLMLMVVDSIEQQYLFIFIYNLSL